MAIFPIVIYDGKLQELKIPLPPNFKELVSFRVTKRKIAITDRIYFAMIEKEGLVGANFVRRHVFSMTGLTTDSNFSPTFLYLCGVHLKILDR